MKIKITYKDEQELHAALKRPVIDLMKQKGVQVRSTEAHPPYKHLYISL